MRAEIKLLTPEFARELLKMNVGNRRLKSIKNAYVGQMINGEWKENGEPIIIDVNGFITHFKELAQYDVSEDRIIKNLEYFLELLTAEKLYNG